MFTGVTSTQSESHVRKQGHIPTIILWLVYWINRTAFTVSRKPDRTMFSDFWTYNEFRNL